MKYVYKISLDNPLTQTTKRPSDDTELMTAESNKMLKSAFEHAFEIALKKADERLAFCTKHTEYEYEQMKKKDRRHTWFMGICLIATIGLLCAFVVMTGKCPWLANQAVFLSFSCFLFFDLVWLFSDRDIDINSKYIRAINCEKDAQEWYNDVNEYHALWLLHKNDFDYSQEANGDNRVRHELWEIIETNGFLQQAAG